MQRVVILGRGAAGKSTLARRLGEPTGLPATELDKLFWQSGLASTPRAEWVLAYRRDSVPRLRAMISQHAPDATVHVLRSPGAAEQFLGTVVRRFETTGERPRRL